LFNVCCSSKNCSSARCASAANVVCKDVDVFLAEMFALIVIIYYSCYYYCHYYYFSIIIFLLLLLLVLFSLPHFVCLFVCVFCLPLTRLYCIITHMYTVLCL
jgi:hypothetical protein